MEKMPKKKIRKLVPEECDHKAPESDLHPTVVKEA